MPLFVLSLLIQVGFAVHAVKTGRDSKWLYFILLFPLVGCTVYFIVEVLPDLRHSKTVRRANRFVADTVDPNRDLRKSAEKLEELSSVDNVVDFADHCMAKGHYREAIRVYRNALNGVFATDPKLLLGLARALFEQGDYGETIETLDVLIEHNPDFKSTDGHLLYARALELSDNIDRALHEYEVLSQYYAGPEAKCRYALLLKRLGKESLASGLFEEIKRTAKRSPKHYSQLHKEWIDIAFRETQAR